jgi:preprotein translocase subunit SecE
MRQIIKFLQEVASEFKNITWPKKEALIQLTFVVISISIIISLILGGFDYLFTQSINFLSKPTNQVNNQNIAPVVTVAPSPEVTQVATPSIKVKK